MTICERIDAELKKRNLSRRQLAVRAGIPPSSLQSAMQRNGNLSIDMVLKIAGALGITYSRLVLGDEKEKFLNSLPPEEKEREEEYERELYYGALESIYMSLPKISSGNFAEVFRQCFPKLNEQGQEKLAGHLKALIKKEEYRQEPMPKPKDKGPGRVAPFANSDPQPSKSGSQDPGKEE